jgi:hypothetical protein
MLAVDALKAVTVRRKQFSRIRETTSLVVLEADLQRHAVVDPLDAPYEPLGVSDVVAISTPPTALHLPCDGSQDGSQIPDRASAGRPSDDPGRGA